MNHTSSKNPQIQKLLEKCLELLAYKEIVLCWIPCHIGIQGNETIDKQAKTSLSLEPTSFKAAYSVTFDLLILKIMFLFIKNTVKKYSNSGKHLPFS